MDAERSLVQYRDQKYMLKFYGYKKCSTCRKAEKFFQQAEIPYEFFDITENLPTEKELAEVAKLSGTPLKKLFNTSGIQYRELKIKTQLPTLSDPDILALLTGNGRLIKRPLITSGERATVGFKEELFVDTWC
jgi:arsenate reductase